MILPISKKWSLPLILLAFSLPAIAGDSLPAAQDINDAAQKSKRVSDSFFSQTFTIRMQHEYSGRFLNQQDKDAFCKAANQASTELEQIANDQNDLKRKIENYQGDDWEILFGSTGLWRKLAADLIRTQAGKLEIDSYSAIADEVKTECPPSAVRGGCADIKASMGKIRCFGPSEPNELNDIAMLLAKSECSNNREMFFSLALLQRRFAPDEFQNTLVGSPQTALLLGQIILTDLSTQSNFESINPTDAELAAIVALQTNPQLYADLIVKLAENDKFQTPAVLYAAAEAYETPEKQKAVELLIRASNLQLKRPNVLLKKTAEQIAEQAFQMAYREFTEHPNNFQPAIDAFQNYSRIAQDKIDEQTQFLYANLLNHCNRTSEAVEIFSRISDGSQSVWRDAAILELLKIKISNPATPAESNQVIAELRDFILRCNQPDEKTTQLRLAAMNIYCTNLLYQDNNNSAQQVLQILDTAAMTPYLPYDFFRAAAFQQLGRLEESTHFMSQGIDNIDSSRAAYLISLLSEVLDEIELWEQQAGDFNQMRLDCNTLAEFAYKFPKNRQAALSLAEVSILRADIDRAELLLHPLADENDIGWLRTRARLLMAQGQFEQSAKLWAKIAELRRNESAVQNQKNYGWWQAKFYELDCLAKIPHSDKQNISHTIEVLQNSYTDIHRPWAEKLDGLKKMCSN